MIDWIAKRRLRAVSKADGQETVVTIKVSRPALSALAPGGGSANPDEAYCWVDFEGTEQPALKVYGADELQALELASNLDPILEAMRSHYDFYWESGEKYFD